ncbi:family 20 glycosylhydrolase [Erysipelothrix tonsillarum]|uniref:family 20 glycosylhydrolase n=1 Tax=Erysipelothrix tonsillarum TaxID=38402 RepID=UPI0003A5D6FC|nr:family 20 glycosylhydrolase [Erysipelothrix tonsillarum]
MMYTHKLIQKAQTLYPNAKVDTSKIQLNHSVLEHYNYDGYQVHYNDDDLIVIASNTERGHFYGLLDIFAGEANPHLTKAKVQERGLHVDLGRKFFSQSWFFDVIDMMARFKLNTLQIHFSEHLGFRIESKRFPRIVSEEHLSQDAVKAIIKHANDYYIDIIPSFDSPGHLQVVLEAYPEYLMPNTTMGLDITSNAARDFIKAIYDEMDTLFETSTSFHMGADEFIDFGKYDQFPQLEAYAKEHFGPDAKGFDTFVDYVNDIAAYLQSRGKTVRAWNDGLYRLDQKPTVRLNQSIIITYWTSWNPMMAPVQTFVDAGHKVVNYMDQLLYFVLGENAGYTYPTEVEIIRDFEPNRFSNRHESCPGPHQQEAPALGAMFSIWCDRPDALTSDAVRHKIEAPLKAFAIKSWGQN